MLRRFTLDELVVGRKPVGLFVIDPVLAVAPHSHRVLEVLLVHDVEEKPAVLLFEELVQCGEQLHILAAHCPSERDGPAQRECLADIGAVAELEVEHVARGHGEIEPPFAHLLDQRLGLRIFRRGIDIELQAGITEPLEGAPVGAARAHRHGTSSEILDAENGVVVVASHQIVVDVVERARHHHAGRARRPVRGQCRGGNICGPSFEHVEQRCVLRSDHHLDMQVLAFGEFAQQLVLEADLLAAPQEERRRVVAGDDAQHAPAPDLGQVTISFAVHQVRDLLSREESIERFKQIRRVRTDRPRHRIALEWPGDDSQSGPIVPEPLAVADVDCRDVQPSFSDTRQQFLRWCVLRHDADIDVRMSTACALHDVPERRLLPDGDFASREIAQGVDAIARPYHDVFPSAMGRNCKCDLLLARIGDGDVRGDEVALARHQGRNERVRMVYLYPVHVEKVFFGEAPNENTVELERVRRDAAAGVADFRLAARDDDGDGPPRSDQLER